MFEVLSEFPKQISLSSVLRVAMIGTKRCNVILCLVLMFRLHVLSQYINLNFKQTREILFHTDKIKLFQLFSEKFINCGSTLYEYALHYTFLTKYKLNNYKLIDLEHSEKRS